MEQKTIIALILGILFLVTAIQAFQLKALDNKVSEEIVKIGSAAPVTKSTTTVKTPTKTSSGSKRTSSLPSNINNLPQMVGGC